MNVQINPVEQTLESLSRAAASWVEDGDEGKLARWLGRELDADGVPRRIGVPDWQRCLGILAEARRRKGDWPPSPVEAIDGLVLAALRFARSDGRPVMHAGPMNGVPPVCESPDWKRWYRKTGIGRVLGWWFGGQSRGSGSVPFPPPAWSAGDRVLAMLRPDWMPGGDFLAVDHRDPRSPCRIELFGGGRTWLGPEWDAESGSPGGPASRPRPSRWITSASADLIEWRHRLGGARITRSALLLHGRRLAMLSIQVEGSDRTAGVEPISRLWIPPDVAARPIKEARLLALTGPGRRGTAYALPIALPCRPYATDRGSFRAEDGAIVLRQAPAGRRCWLPLLLSWDADRHRKVLDWRVLTVSERSRIVPPDRAFAARVSWGRDETYVIYRSLGPPARRAFLGHQTAASFLVAGFDEDGDLKPLLTVE